MTTDARVVPIGDYGLVGDTRTAALIAPDGSIEWWCVPRFDDPPVFGRLVGGETAGCFTLGPVRPPVRPARCYRGDTATLVTTWRVDGAEVVLEDSMVAEVSDRLLPATVLVRRISCRGSDVPVGLRFAPRFGYGRERPRRAGMRGGALVCEHRDLVVAVTSDCPAEIVPDDLVEWVLTPGRPVTVVVTGVRRGPAVLVPPAVAVAAVERDERGWASWCDGIAADLAYRHHIVRSLLTLQLLTYSPSGAPVAAPTTSLPEEIGGSRNWDYRFAWPRDASIGISGFLAAGRDQEARAFVAWLLHATRLARPRLPVLLSLDGRHAPPERELADWPGYADSRPVRIGNGAAGQHQLDGYGWVIDAAWALTRAGHQLYRETWRAMAALADSVARTWREPDAGIWERRGPPAHHVHSKLMGWLALDRAARIAATQRVRSSRRDHWIRERDALAADIRDRGYNEQLGAYTGIYDTDQLDAAVLLLPVLDFEPEGSPRVRGTIDAIHQRLSAGGPLLFRYQRGRDDLPGGEGAFLPCSFWLAQALARTGRIDDATDVFEQLLGVANPLGLYAEELDPASREHLGNFPQALTHAALVQAAIALQQHS
jgi:GH15 family glucan-1,4-alpha-glucosidase